MKQIFFFYSLQDHIISAHSTDIKTIEHVILGIKYGN